MKLTTQLRVVSRLRMSGAVPLLLLCLHGLDKDNFTVAQTMYVT